MFDRMDSCELSTQELKEELYSACNTHKFAFSKRDHKFRNFTYCEEIIVNNVISIMKSENFFNLRCVNATNPIRKLNLTYPLNGDLIGLLFSLNFLVEFENARFAQFKV